MARTETEGDESARADEYEHEHEHRPPAPEDWPRGFGEASWWPLVTGVGAAGVYFGAALFLVSRGPDPLVNPIFAPLVLVPGAGAFLAGLYGWLYHGFVRHYWLRSPPGMGVDLRWGWCAFSRRTS